MKNTLKFQRDRDVGSAGPPEMQLSETASDDAISARSGLRPTITSKRQKSLASAARRSAERRDRHRGMNNMQTPVSTRNRPRERASLTGGFVRRKPTSYSSMLSSRRSSIADTQSARSEFDAPVAAAREVSGSESWSLELEQLKAPVLTKATPEALINFRVKWEDYADKIDQLAKKFQAPVAEGTQRTSR